MDSGNDEDPLSSDFSCQENPEFLYDEVPVENPDDKINNLIHIEIGFGFQKDEAFIIPNWVSEVEAKFNEIVDGKSHDGGILDFWMCGQSLMFAKGLAIGQDVVNKAKAFDEKHRLIASASEKVISFDRKAGLTEKLTVGISMVNEKVNFVDQRVHVSDKIMAAIFAIERKFNDRGSAIKTSRYVTVGAAWLNGAFGKGVRAGQVAVTKTRGKFHMVVSNLQDCRWFNSVFCYQNK
ncbi:hypothetical protein ACFX16_007291 [Malus domestica]